MVLGKKKMQIPKKTIFNLLVFATFFIGIISVGKSQNLQFASEFFGSKTFLHSPSMRFVIPEKPWGLSLEVNYQTKGDEAWSKYLRNPRIGLNAVFKDFGNAPILGYAYGLVPFADFPLMQEDKFKLWFRFAFGVDIITKSYDRLTNYDNNAIGTVINNLTYLGLIAEYQFHDHWGLRFGGSFMHTSNGAIIMPNLGLNTADWRIGLYYQPSKSPHQKNYSKSKTPFNNKILWNFRVGQGSEEFKVPDGPNYPVYVLAAFVSRQISPVNKLNVGLEWNYYPANQAFNVSIGVPLDEVSPQFQPGRLAATFGHELLLGHVGFAVTLFMYVDHPFEGSGWFGNKLGPILYLYDPNEIGRRKNVFIAGLMKSHGSVADYIEVTMGVSF